MENSCKQCGSPLTSCITRPLREPHPVQRTHAIGPKWIVRHPADYEVIGECMKHGLQRYVPMGAPTEVTV